MLYTSCGDFYWSLGVILTSLGITWWQSCLPIMSLGGTRCVTRVLGVSHQVLGATNRALGVTDQVLGVTHQVLGLTW